MASFPYSSFQVIFGRSDPRTALIFSHPFEAVYPHIVTMAQELRCTIVRYPPSSAASAAAGADGEGDKGAAGGGASSREDSIDRSDAYYQQQHEQHRSFSEVFEEAFNEGKWLVVDTLSRVEHLSWRHVGAKLAVTVPSAKHHLRKHFRLFTFLSIGQDVHVYVPPIMLQFALVVDTTGMVHAKSSVGPLFETDTMVDDINQVLSSRQLLEGRGGGGDGDGSGGGLGAASGLSGNAGGAGGNRGKKGGKAARDDTSRNNPYTSVSSAKVLSRGDDDYYYGDDDSDKAGAMTDTYIDEVLAALREELLADQEELIVDVNRATELRVGELDRRLATRMGILGEVAEADELGRGGGNAHHSTYDADRARSQIVEEEMRRANDNFEWIYPAMHRWAVMQHPNLDERNVQAIPDEEVTKDRLLWQTPTETCHSGVWYGSDVLIKGPILGYSTDKNHQYQQASRGEASLHATLRHPHVIALHGVLAGDKCTMLLEDGVGTVEQTFMRLREENRHWRVRDYLTLAQHVLRGMTYLSTRITHRDIAARSIIEVRPGGATSSSPSTFKIGQFQCAYPIKAQSPEGRSLVPIRWSAPEALSGRFHTKSDVWSFGIMMWECLHYCCELPFAKYAQAAEAIVEGKIVECKTMAAKFIFEKFVFPCLEYEIAHRPTAADLLAEVDRALFNQDPHVLDRRIPMPGDVDQKDPYPNPTPP